MSRASNALAKHWPMLAANAVTTALVVGLVYWLWLLRESFDAQLVVVWTTGSLVGLLATCWTLSDSLAERAALRSRSGAVDQVLAVLAAANVRREAFRCAVFVCPLWIGASVLFGFVNVTVSRSLLIAMVALLIANSILDRIERHATAEVVRRSRPEHTPSSMASGAAPRD